MAYSKAKAMRLASSHLITSCATFAAILLFVLLGSRIVPGMLGAAPMSETGLVVVFILNIAIILFGWRRSKDLKEALDAHDHAEQAAHDAAYSDFTTGLANRRQLMEVLQDAIATGTKGTLVLLDLDEFKKVNDLHGHFAGDQLLKSVADILIQKAPEGSCCARTGGDEFAILIPRVDKATVEEVARAVLDRLAQPFMVETSAASISASIGLLELTQKMTAVNALRHSDIAMYAAKKAGKNCFAWFDSDLAREVQERAQLEVDIKAAVGKGEFVPYFQPLMSLETGELVGFEVLARWNSPERGHLEPKSFISIAEHSGSIGALSLAVMEQALAQAKHWPANLTLAVNISPLQFRDPQLASRIIQILVRTGFPGPRLELEITESSLLEDPGLVTTTIASLKNLGITVSLDDFGTGYASLSQLQTLPFDRIKIDQSFVHSLDTNKQSEAIVSTISALGKSLCVRVTAEGVESEAVRSMLSDLGCTEAQGWLFGRAVSGEAIEQLLSKNAPSGGSNERRGPGMAGTSEAPRAAGL